MPKQDHISLTASYDVCMHGDCPLAASCLRHIAFNTLKQTEEILRLINPDKCTQDATCPYYREDKMVVYARGFTNFQERMFPRQYQTFMSICMDRFSRSGYFERRRGEYGLPPEEQQFILRALRQAGVTEEMKFDSYEERRNWYD